MASMVPRPATPRRPSPLPQALAVLRVVAAGLGAGWSAPATVTAAPGPPTATQLEPGHVDRTSLALRATYDARMTLGFDTRAMAVVAEARITNTSTASIDRIELNTIAARLGSMHLTYVTVDGRVAAASVVDQTIVVPLGGVLPVGATTTVRLRYTATLRTSLSGSSWLFTRANGIVDAYRWLPWVSRQIAFDRPNSGDPFETPASPFVRYTVVTDRPLVIATTGDRVYRSPDKLTQTFEARDVRDVTITAAPDFHTRERTVDGTLIRTYYRSAANAGTIMDAAANALSKLQARLGDYPYPTFKVVQSAGGYAMESPRLIWIPYGTASVNVRYQVTHETAHQWFYGLVGNDQAKQPYADEAAADFVARDVLGIRRASQCATGRLDLDIYHYSDACYYERIYIQGGNLLDAARDRMGSTAFWAALKGYVARHRYGISTTRSLLDALDAETTKDLGGTLFAPRFPSLY
jgi:hypothetical protein